MSHAKLSPSSASRWLNCPGSIKASEGIEDKSSPYAQEGILAHEIAEACLRNQTDPMEYKVTAMGEGMAEHIAVYVDYVNTINGYHSYEQKVDFSHLVPDGFGTVDALIIDGNTIHVVDLKYGKGVQVFAEDNPQLMLYAIGAYSEVEMLYDVQKVVLHVVQPRLDHIDVWETTPEALLKWGAWVQERANLALSDDAPFAPGEDQCRFCLVQATCQALYDYSVEILGQEFKDLSDNNPGQLSEAKIREVLENAELIRGWLNAVEDHVFNLLNEGGDFKGFKLVEGRSLRKWKDENEAVKLLEQELGDQAYEKKILSPAKAEKALGKKKTILKDLIIKPAGKPTLAPDNDKRPAIQQAAAEQFENLNA